MLVFLGGALLIGIWVGNWFIIVSCGLGLLITILLMLRGRS